MGSEADPSTEARPGQQRHVDCDAGRRLGCATFCCRLIVHLEPEEAVAGRTPAGTLAKDPRDGWCVHLERDSKRCAIWEARPAICRRYDCNRDPLLQVQIRDSYGDLVAGALREPAAGAVRRVQVPYRASEE